MKIKTDTVKGLALLILILVIPIVGFQLNKAPKVLPENAPLNEFSAARAMKHLEQIAAEPHSIGTDAHARVREYIVAQLKKMGIEPEIQTAEFFSPGTLSQARSYVAATVRNIIVTLPGTVPGKSVLVVGHYDSVRDSYGANDDGSGVVTMLETIRILLLDKPFRNDIVFLFTDGEEIGLCGAEAFIDGHPLAENIGMVLNFEGGGSTGSSMMFETSKDNNRIISQFAKVVPYPIASSLFYEIYRNMPNDTDLTPFKKHGNQGFNFAYNENRFDYHTASDNFKNTSAETIQHHGSYAVPLVQYFAGIDLNQTEKGNAVFFNTIGKGFAHYSYKWIVPFTILTSLLLIGLLVAGFRKKRIRPLRLLFGFLAFIFHLVIAPALVTLIYFILLQYYPGTDSLLLYYNQNTLLLGFFCLATTVSFLFYKLALKGMKLWHLITLVAFFLVLLIWSGKISLITVLATAGVAVSMYFLYRKPTQVWELTFGSFLGWAIIMIVAGFLVPGVSYLFTWPLLFAMIPFGIYLLKKDPDEYSLAQTGWFVLAALPVLLWLPYLTYLFLTVMGLKLAGGSILITVLGLSLLIPHIEIITKTRPWLVPVLSFTAALVFLLVGSVHLQYTERYRQRNSLILLTNGNTNQTFFTTYDSRINEWSADYLSGHPDTLRMDNFLGFGEGNFLSKKVESEQLATPDLVVTQDSISNNQRFLKLHLNSVRKAHNLFFKIKSNSDPIKVSINGTLLKTIQSVTETHGILIRYYALPEEGIEVDMQLLSTSGLELILTDIIYGLPVLNEMKIKPRPNFMMSNGDMTVATKKFIL